MTRIAYLLAGAALAGVLIFGYNISRAALPPPAIQGPSLGDQNTNIYTIQQAMTSGNQLGFAPAISASQTLTQAGCTQLNFATNVIITSASTGSVCLPTAFAGREIVVGNGVSGQTINIYSSVASVIPGTTDTINGVAGTTAYTGLTTGKNTQCFAGPANATAGSLGLNGGAWYCSSGQ